jgi:uncharacterized protein with PQ loop repeat
MTTEVPAAKPGRRAADLTVSIILMVVGVIVLVLEAILDVLLVFTSADSPGDIEGATNFAFLLLFVGGAIWLIASIVAIVLLVRVRRAWWLALIAVVVPLGCAVGGFVAVSSVVQ